MRGVSVIVGARYPRLLTSVVWEPPTIQVCRFTSRQNTRRVVPQFWLNQFTRYCRFWKIDLQQSEIASDVRTKGWETQPLRRILRLRISLDCLVAMKCQQNIALSINHRGYKDPDLRQVMPHEHPLANASVRHRIVPLPIASLCRYFQPCVHPFQFRG